MKRYRNLKELPFFEGVSPEILEDMQRRGKIRNMKKGTVCFRAAEKQDMIYILMDGQAISYTLTRCGSRKIIFVHGGGELLNESIIEMERTTIFCELIRNSVLFVISNREFCQLMERDFSLVKAVMRMQERKLWRTSHQLKNTLGSIYLEKKLAAKIWKLARDFGMEAEDKSVVIDIQLSITFLADLLGAPRETTSRVCKNLVERGLIFVEKKTITVRNMDCLARFYKNRCGVDSICTGPSRVCQNLEES